MVEYDMRNPFIFWLHFLSIADMHFKCGITVAHKGVVLAPDMFLVGANFELP
jgi:hypothetical protein